MSMQDLFGSDSENSDDDSKKPASLMEELPSTQAHMDELFGASDNDEENHKPSEEPDEGSSDSSSSDEEEDEVHQPSALNNASKAIENDLNFSDDEMPAARRNISDDESMHSDDGGNRRIGLNDNDHEQPEKRENASGDDDNDSENGMRDNASGDDDNDSENGMRDNATGDDDKDSENGTRDNATGDDDFDNDNAKRENASGNDGDDNKGNSMPTTQDLFGDEDLDVSSDEDEPQKSPQPSQQGLLQQDDERPPTPEKEKEEEGLSIAIELPRCNISLGKEQYFVKLPNFISVDTKPFDPNFYEDEIDEDEILDEEGRARLKLKVENTIRWRYTKDKNGDEIKESNCRFVRWSDGSLSMHLGTEVFDVFKMPIEGEQNHLFVQQGTGLQAQAVFKNKLSFRPHSTASQTHRKMTMSIADRISKAQRIKMMPAMERDPETQRESMIKKEDERLRTQARRESQQRRVRERNHAKGLHSNYVDQDMEDDDDFDISIAAIKNRSAREIKEGKSYDLYDDEDSEEENKLQEAKLDIDSDEDDEELKRKKEELAKKKKLGRKVIDESDDESD